MRLFQTAEQPRWWNDFTRSLEEGLRGPREYPLRLQTFAAAANLPAAAEYRAGIVYITAITMVAVSDGTNWRRLDTGATL